jgi:hypothetical protein
MYRSWADLSVAALLAVAAAGCGDSGGGTGGGSATSTSGGDGGAADGGGPASVASSVVVSSVASSTSTGGPDPCSNTASTVQGECDLLQQNCPDGGHCTWKLQGGDFTTVCEPRAGLKNLGAECEIDDECEAGLFCVFSVCTPVCCPATDAPCNGGNCNLNFTLDGDDSVRLCTYSKQCEPLTADACPEDTGCHFEEPQVATCVPGSGEEVGEGEDCVALNDCDNMQQCSQIEGGVCRYICLLEENSQPPGFGGCLVGQSCVTSPEIGFTGLGICSG